MRFMIRANATAHFNASLTMAKNWFDNMTFYMDGMLLLQVGTIIYNLPAFLTKPPIMLASIENNVKKHLTWFNITVVFKNIFCLNANTL